jgi:hypothetical protein
MDRLTTIHDAFRDLVTAAEAAGWDIGDNKATLDRAREGFAALVDLHAGEIASEPEWDDPGQRGRPCPSHEWAYTGSAYGGDDDSYHGEGRCYCIHCGADGDA